MENEADQLVYRPREAMKKIGICQTKFYALLKEGKLDARKIGSATVITAASLNQFVAALPRA